MRPKKYDYGKIIGLYIENKPYEEIAKIVGCSEKTVYGVINKYNIGRRGKGGALSHRNKLTEAQVIEIYKLRFEQLEYYKDIAAKYDVSETAIIFICSGKNWKETYKKYFGTAKSAGKRTG